MGGPSPLMQFIGANCYDRWKLFIIAGTASSARSNSSLREGHQRISYLRVTPRLEIAFAGPAAARTTVPSFTRRVPVPRSPRNYFVFEGESLSFMSLRRITFEPVDESRLGRAEE